MIQENNKSEPTNKPDLKTAEEFLKENVTIYSIEDWPKSHKVRYVTLDSAIRVMESYKNHHVQAMQEAKEYEYGSVICDSIDDILTSGGSRPLYRSVPLMMKIAQALKESGFKIFKSTKPEGQ